MTDITKTGTLSFRWRDGTYYRRPVRVIDDCVEYHHGDLKKWVAVDEDLLERVKWDNGKITSEPPWSEDE